MLRVLLKALLLFVVLNLIFAAIKPMDWLGQASLYHSLLPARERLPYGEVPAKDFNLTLDNIPAMFASHAVSRDKADDEFRVLLLGDSGVWGWFLNPDETLAGQLNQMNLRAADDRRIVVYNLGYPVMSLTKDLLILDEAMAFEPDLILWPVTLQSFARARQLDHPLLRNNPGRVRQLIERFGLRLDTADPRLIDRNLLQETIVGRRRDLADLLRLQLYGFSWAATGIDQAIPDEIPARAVDLKEDLSWLDIAGPQPLTDDDLAFEVIAAGISRAGRTPVILINEPMFISDGLNSAMRYNSFYPRWAYDEYRTLLADKAAQAGWTYLDLWDSMPPDEITDTPVHLSPAGVRLLAERIASAMGW